MPRPYVLPSTGWAGLGPLLFFPGWVGTFGAQLDGSRGLWGPGGKRHAGDRRPGHHGPRSRRPTASPPPAGRARGGAGCVPAPRRSGGRAGADRAGWAGDTRRSGAPHRPRRLARAPTVPVAAGGGSQAVEEGGEAEEAEAGAPLAADSLPGLSRERYGAPALGPQPPAPGPRWG